ncbi:hypothetical protein [Spiroplasma endosymbiont of Aspidapion aeneum]|uniref:hypothetical protein n=1 Tax=Spiroplasma endosymbiont of Aspidapion aeneum TaxID=3066276 RepID=UPI00313DAD94
MAQINNDKNFLRFKNRFKKSLAFFITVISLNKKWYILSLLLPVSLVLVFNFNFINKLFMPYQASFNHPENINIDKWIEQIYSVYEIYATVFFGIFYIVIFIPSFIFGYILFFKQLKSKYYRYAFYSGLSRNCVLYVLLFSLSFLLIINAIVVLGIVSAIGFPIYENRLTACWEIFNIYINVFLFILLIIIGGYLLWNKPNTLYLAIIAIFSILLIIVATISRIDYLILYIKYYCWKWYGKDVVVFIKQILQNRHWVLLNIFHLFSRQWQVWLQIIFINILI